MKSTLRKTVLEAYRSRGKSINNLWLVYSAKTNSDWILPSDRQLIHWLYFLEANADVRTFDLAPEPILSEDENEARATELDALVTTRMGQVEWHEVKAGRGKKDSAHAPQATAQARAAAKEHATYRRFDDTDLKPHAKVAMRWAKAMSFAAAIAGQEYIACRTSMLLAFKRRGSGTVRQLLDDLAECDSAVVHGMLVRLAVTGIVHIDLSVATYGLMTHWTYHGDRTEV
jgi:hypothetical protein